MEIFEKNTPYFKHKLVLLKKKLKLIKKEIQDELELENDELELENDELNTAFDSSINPFKKLDVSKALIELLEEKIKNC